MAHLIFHAGVEGKATRKSISGLIRHMQRKTIDAYKNHGNKDINPDLTEWNIDILRSGKTVDEYAKNRLEKEYKGAKVLRKDQVILREIIIAPSPDTFENMTIEEKQSKMLQFMKDSLPWLKNEFGDKNIAGASVHLDETNPHAHVGVMMMTKDGRISQRDFFKGPNDLHRMHREFRKHMIEKGWDFQQENKNEDFDYVDLPTFKKHAKALEEKREEHRKIIAALAESPDVQQDAFRAAYNAVYDEVLERERMDLEREKEAVEARKNALREKQMRLKYMEKNIETIYLAVTENIKDLTTADREDFRSVSEKGIMSLSPNKIVKNIDFAIVKAVDTEQENRLKRNLTYREEIQPKEVARVIDLEDEIEDDGPEL